MVKFGNNHQKALKTSVIFLIITSLVFILFNLFSLIFFSKAIPDIAVNLSGQIISMFISALLLYFALAQTKIFKHNFSNIIKDEERKYQILFENANDAILLIRDHFIIDCNLKSCEIFNCNKFHLIGKSLLKLSQESENFEILLELIKQSATAPQKFEWKYNRCSNEAFDAEVSLNQVDLGGLFFVQVIIKDVSELKRTQQSMSENVEKFKMIFNSVSDGIIIFAEDNEVLEVNQTVLNRYGFNLDEVLGKHTRRSFPKEIIDAIHEHIPELKDQETITFDIENVKAKDKTLFLEMRIKMIIYEGRKAILAVARDITQRKLNQKIVYNAVIQAEELERSRVAKELHDGVSPILSTAKLYAQSLRDCKNEVLKGSILNKIEMTVDESIQSISEISNNLSPHILQNFGLTAAVRAFVDKIQELKKIEITYKTNFKERLVDDLEVTLYRVTIELINNTIKHAQASKINIILNKTCDLELEYTDNGIGMDIKEILKKKKGMGLFNITNRVKSLNGVIQYYSKPDEGLKVNVKFQLHDK